MSAEAAFAAALGEFQATLPRIAKGNTAQVRSDKGNYSYDYADLTDIAGAVLPALAAVGLSFTSRSAITEGRFVLEASLLHKDGHREVSTYPLPDPSRATPQQIGSAMTYGRRYALCCLTGVAPGGDDDDAQAANHGPAAAAPVRTVEDFRAKHGPDPDEVTAWITHWCEQVDAAFSREALDELADQAKAKSAAGFITNADAADLKLRWKQADDRLSEQIAKGMAEAETPGHVGANEAATGRVA